MEEYEYEMHEDMQYGDTTAGGDLDMMTADGPTQEMTVEKKLQLAERANEIYREQVRYLQEHLNSIRNLVQDKESIIENLMLRYDLGILQQDMTHGNENIPSDRIEDKELRRKAEALAQRTILENFELRELVNELRDENFHLRNEIYDLQDRANRQALHISKLTKSIPVQTQQDNNFETQGNFVNQGNFAPQGNFTTQDNFVNQFVAANDDTNPEALVEEAQRKHEERAQKHNRRQSSVAQPKDFWDTNEQEEEEEEDITPQQNTGNAHNTATQENLNDENEREQGQEFEEEEEEEVYMTEEAKKKRDERHQKLHQKKNTLETPAKFFDDDYAVEDTDTANQPSNATNNQTNPPNNQENNTDRPNKRRGSTKLEMVDPRLAEEAEAKRKQRQDKEHTRKETLETPNIFEPDYANTEEAKKIREERARKARKESIAVPKGFLNVDEEHDSEDEASREKRRKHQRKQSLMKAVGDKGHLSDEDTEKSQRVDYDTRRKLDRVSRQKTKEASSTDKTDATTHHRRESSMPIPDLKFEDPATLLAGAQDEVKTLKQQLTQAQDEKKVIEKQLQDQKQEAMQMEQTLIKQLEQKITQQVEQKLTQQLTQQLTPQLEQKLSQQVEKRLDEKFQKEKNGLVANNKKEIEQINARVDELRYQLNRATDSKVALIQCANNEINRLNRVINTLLQNDKCKEITRLLLDDSLKPS